MAERKTKTVAKRIDLTYHRQPSPLRSFRRVLVIVCAVAALAWGGWALIDHREGLYNPGPVTASHAMFENNCAACHDGGGGGAHNDGKFLKTVSDTACLSCHDGAIHSDRQVTLASLTSGGKPAMSSNCVTCHVEHKGHDALAGTSDLLCTRCHDNLTANVAGGRTEMQASVKSFDMPPAHPTFGRVLRANRTGEGAMGRIGETAATSPVLQVSGAPAQSDKWVDPTPLKFNHKKHLSEISPTVGECSNCHRTSLSGNHRIMLPVSYDANCKSCHALTLAANLPDVPHEQMNIVRLFTATIPQSFSQKLATMTPAEKEAALTITTTKKVGLRNVTEKKTVTEAEWLEAQTKDLIEKKVAGSAAANQPAYKAAEALTEPAARNAAALELYAAYGMQTSCSYCHTLTGAPGGVAKSAGELLRTLPTGYAVETAKGRSGEPATSQPAVADSPDRHLAGSIHSSPVPTPEGRRWFTASVFNHDSHRSMSCVDCHGQASGSTMTSDVLLPDLQTCVNCHHTGGRDRMAASNNCVTCHVYHDRSKEQTPMKGRTLEELLGKHGKQVAVAK